MMHRMGCGALVLLSLAAPLVLRVNHRLLDASPPASLPGHARFPDHGTHFDPFEYSIPLLPLYGLPVPALLLASLGE